MKFSLLHPSRSRPTKSFNAIAKWINYARLSDLEVIVSIDESDPLKSEYLKLYSQNERVGVKVITNPNRSAVEAINNAAKVSTGEILIVVSDDTDCIKGWDNVISQATGTHKDYVLKVNDGIQDWIVTMPIMDRTYYNRFGYVYYPEFSHMFCDTYLTHVADALDRLIIRNDIIIPHLHYSVRKSEKDEVTRRADSTFNDGKNIYMRLLRDNLKLPPSVNIWSLSKQAASHLQWINQARK